MPKEVLFTGVILEAISNTILQIQLCKGKEADYFINDSQTFQIKIFRY